MTNMNYKAEVLRQFPDANCDYDGFYYVEYNNLCGVDCLDVETAWQRFYEKYCEKENKTTMKLTRENIKDLEHGNLIILSPTSKYEFNHVEKELVFMINDLGTCTSYSIDFLINEKATIQKPKQYNHLGWEIGDYSNKNVWVWYSDISEEDALKDKLVAKLEAVTEKGFIIDGMENIFAVQLTEVNTQNMKVK